MHPKGEPRAGLESGPFRLFICAIGAICGWVNYRCQGEIYRRDPMARINRGSNANGIGLPIRSLWKSGCAGLRR